MAGPIRVNAATKAIPEGEGGERKGGGMIKGRNLRGFEKMTV